MPFYLSIWLSRDFAMGGGGISRNKCAEDTEWRLFLKWFLSCHLIQKASTILHCLRNKNRHLKSKILWPVLVPTTLYYLPFSKYAIICHHLTVTDATSSAWKGPLLPHFCSSSRILYFGVQLKCTSFIKPPLISYTDIIYPFLNSEATFIPL